MRSGWAEGGLGWVLLQPIPEGRVTEVLVTNRSLWADYSEMTLNEQLSVCTWQEYFRTI